MGVIASGGQRHGTAVMGERPTSAGSSASREELELPLIECREANEGRLCTGAALDVSSVGAARAAITKQTGLDKKTVLNIRPAFLVVPASLELKAEQLVAQNLVPAATSSLVPQSIRTLAPISEPRLNAASETAWYLAASPNQIDTIEYAYLDVQQGAYIETRNVFDVDGVEIKCRLDFGAKAIDWRGLYKNPGA